MDVSDRRMQVQLTPEAKIASDFLYIRAIFAVVGFVSALTAGHTVRRSFRVQARISSAMARTRSWMGTAKCCGQAASQARQPTQAGRSSFA